TDRVWSDPWPKSMAAIVGKHYRGNRSWAWHRFYRHGNRSHGLEQHPIRDNLAAIWFLRPIGVLDVLLSGTGISRLLVHPDSRPPRFGGGYPVDRLSDGPPAAVGSTA